MTRIDMSDNAIRRVLEEADTVRDKLGAKVNGLPSINAEGKSDCPFANELYSKAEELLRQAEGYYQRLHELVLIVDQKIVTRRKDLQLLLKEADGLGSVEAKNDFWNAQHGQANSYGSAVGLRSSLLESIKRMEHVIDMAKRNLKHKRDMESRAAGKKRNGEDGETPAPRRRRPPIVVTPTVPPTGQPATHPGITNPPPVLGPDKGPLM